MGRIPSARGEPRRPAYVGRYVRRYHLVMSRAALLTVALFSCVAGPVARQQPAQLPQPPQQIAPGPPRWQPPDPTNLQVFPKDIPKAQLIQAMRGFTMGLGVRCEFCHVGEGNDLTKFDFASDTKKEKVAARRMITMAREINTKLLAGFPEGRDESTPAVTCYTCHRGEKKPLTARPPQVQ